MLQRGAPYGAYYGLVLHASPGQSRKSSFGREHQARRTSPDVYPSKPRSKPSLDLTLSNAIYPSLSNPTDPSMPAWCSSRYGSCLAASSAAPPARTTSPRKPMSPRGGRTLTEKTTHAYRTRFTRSTRTTRRARTSTPASMGASSTGSLARNLGMIMNS